MKINSQIFKCLFVLLAFFNVCQPVFSQLFTNSWINYSQPYYKFKITETGIFRIDSLTLVNAGIPLSTINPQNIQLFARGAEIPIYIKGEGDGVFNSSDFIEFYGEGNDGWFDESLYGGAVNHPSPHYSLFNDTITYFLTWNNLTTNNRTTLEMDVNFSSFTPINSFFKENLVVYSSGGLSAANPYYDGETQNIAGVGVSLFGFASTEGWFDDPYSLGGSTTKTISTRNAYQFGSNATLNTIVLGESNSPLISTGDQHLRVTVGSNTFDDIFEGHQKNDVQMSIPPADLGAVNTTVKYESVNDLGSGAALQTIAHLKIRYEHTMDLENSTFFNKVFLNDNPFETKSLFSFSNFNAVGDVLFYDLTNNKRIQVQPSGTGYQCLIPNSGNEKECVITSEGQLINISSLSPVNGTSFFIDHGANPIDTAFIIVTHPSLLTGANDYANYRLNPGNLNVAPQNAVVYNIEDLYDQFAYGIEKHPLATREFINYLLNTWSTEPNYLFIIGKSIKSKDSRRSMVNFHNNLVPSYGVPASDNMITAGLNGTSFEPAIPTGRLSAKNNTEIDWYLNKVQQYENPLLGNNGETEWMKRFLHFGGGVNSSEQQTFSAFLNGFKNTIEDTLFGGAVTSFFKNSTAPVQITVSDSIKNLIGGGVAMMTFLGHASATGGFDQNIDDPSLWPDQQGRYPLLMGLACFAGDIHLSSANSTSEGNVLLDNKGVIGFLSSVDLSLASFLNIYANEFYKNLAQKNYGMSIGRQIKNTIISTQQPSLGIASFRNSTGLNITFHGDPAIRLNSFEKPDYMINNESVSFRPTIVTSDIDSFDVDVRITNLGHAVNTPIIVTLQRSFPGSNFQDTIHSIVISAPHFKDTLTFTLPVDVVKGLGMNTFTITVDAPPGVVDELSEDNNTVVRTLNISSGNIVPIYPYDFSIVPSQGVTLKASTAFPFEPVNNYVFQIDTTDYFNSPLMQTTTINQVGGVVTWSPNLLQNMPDSTVYFWRVSKDSTNATGFDWRGSSFQYIDGKEGWQQDHFFQFENNTFELLNYDRNTRTFNFQNKLGVLKARTDGAIGGTIIGGPTNTQESSFPSYFIDQDRIGGNGWNFNSAVHVAVVDTVTFDYWKPLEMNFGQANTAGSSSLAPTTFFVFRNADPAQMSGLANMLNNGIPNGYHIIMWTWYWNSFTAYTPLPASVNSALANLGASLVPNIQDSLPFVLFTKKGDFLSTIEAVGDSITHKNVSVSANIVGSADFANIFSPTLGPATSWDSLSWRMNSLESMPSKDSTVLNLFGIDANGSETLLISNLPSDSGDVRITNQVDANQYPFIKLNAHLRDDSLFTAPQLARWHVTYDDVPEAALDPNVFFSFQNDTVQEGETIKCAIAVKNISPYDMDSLLVSFKVLNQFNSLTTIPFSRQKPLLSDSTVVLTIEFSTLGLGGVNSLLIDVNPDDDQLEKFHFNNVAEIPFYVTTDNINPLLDVTFDGVHILDGDIVSPETEIVIELTDENQFLLLNDTADYAVYVTTPNGTENRIRFGGVESMRFMPASLPKNNAKIIYNAKFSGDGMYRLRVQANDVSNNNSGNLDYIINFEIVNRSTITSIINYPNPFTTSTRFVFTLTGSKVPDIFKIQIMTITGKVVREIHKEELGPINIGRNISEFAWDGTDKYGDRLANGLYLYKVTTRIDDDSIELRETNADSFFKKGYGKMYLFR